MDSVEAVGIVVEWRDDEGWGTIGCPEVPGHCWVHYSAVQVPGYRGLLVGQTVAFRYRPGNQDGYAFVATEVWPEGADRSWVPPAESAPSPAYRGELRIEFGEPHQ